MYAAKIKIELDLLDTNEQTQRRECLFKNCRFEFVTQKF